MDSRQVALVQQSFETAAGLREKVAELFYAELFAIDPSLRAMFKGNMREQHKKLLATLALVVRSLHAPEKILPAVKNLAIKHVDYGVEPEHYTRSAMHCCARSRKDSVRALRPRSATRGSRRFGCWQKS